MKAIIILLMVLMSSGCESSQLWEKQYELEEQVARTAKNNFEDHKFILEQLIELYKRLDALEEIELITAPETLVLEKGR